MKQLAWQAVRAGSSGNPIPSNKKKRKAHGEPDGSDVPVAFRTELAYRDEGEMARWIRIARAVKFQLPEFVRRCGVSRRQFERKMSERGLTPEQWLAEQRFHAALPLLAEGELSVKQVALELGYKQCSHFCRQFKKLAGITPSHYRAKFTDWHGWHRSDQVGSGAGNVTVG